MGRLHDAEETLKQIRNDIDAYFALKGEKTSRPIIDKSKESSCKYCNKDGFYWADTQYGWRLFDAKGEQHMCRINGKGKK